MHFDISAIVTIVVSLFGSGGLCWVIIKILLKDTVKETMKEEIKEIYDEITYIKEQFVTCIRCNDRHKAVDDTFKSIDTKLDLIIEKLIK